MSKTFDQQEKGTARPGKTNYGSAKAAGDKGSTAADKKPLGSLSNSPRSTPGRPSTSDQINSGSSNAPRPNRPPTAYEPPLGGGQSSPKPPRGYRNRRRRRPSTPQIQCTHCRHTANLRREVWEDQFQRNREQISENAHRFKCKKCRRKGGITIL